MEQTILLSASTPILLPAAAHLSLPCHGHLVRLSFCHFNIWEVAFTSWNTEHAYLLWNFIRVRACKISWSLCSSRVWVSSIENQCPYVYCFSAPTNELFVVPLKRPLMMIYWDVKKTMAKSGSILPMGRWTFCVHVLIRRYFNFANSHLVRCMMSSSCEIENDERIAWNVNHRNKTKNQTSWPSSKIISSGASVCGLVSSNTIFQPRVCPCPGRLLGHRGAWLEERFPNMNEENEITIKWIWKLWAYFKWKWKRNDFNCRIRGMCNA